MDSTKTNRNQSRKIFTVCADEGTDVANKEQQPLIIRVVDQSGMIREELLGFVLCDTGTSGQAMADKIKFTLEKLTLDLNDLRGQGYNGAGNMSVKYKGAAAIIKHDILRHYTSIVCHM